MIKWSLYITLDVLSICLSSCAISYICYRYNSLLRKMLLLCRVIYLSMFVVVVGCFDGIEKLGNTLCQAKPLLRDCERNEILEFFKCFVVVVKEEEVYIKLIGYGQPNKFLEKCFSSLISRLWDKFGKLLSRHDGTESQYILN
jgi:hypothetical protein